ncbi:MAG: hypothetical protein JWM10_278, partial [Myxococcaceae bacterium]|nr:hypothetical protein [Myxococcaceae bacterium]
MRRKPPSRRRSSPLGSEGLAADPTVTYGAGDLRCSDARRGPTSAAMRSEGAPPDPEILVCVSRGLRVHAGGATDFRVRGGTVNAALADLAAHQPGLCQQVLDAEGLRPEVQVFLGLSEVREFGGMQTPLVDGDVLRIAATAERERPELTVTQVISAPGPDRPKPYVVVAIVAAAVAAGAGWVVGLLWEARELRFPRVPDGAFGADAGYTLLALAITATALLTLAATATAAVAGVFAIRSLGRSVPTSHDVVIRRVGRVVRVHLHDGTPLDLRPGELDTLSITVTSARPTYAVDVRQGEASATLQVGDPVTAARLLEALGDGAAGRCCVPLSGASARAVVGDDGFVVASEAGERFVSYARVRSADATASGVAVELDDGGRVELAVAPGAASDPVGARRRSALLGRLRAGLTAWAERVRDAEAA